MKAKFILLLLIAIFASACSSDDDYNDSYGQMTSRPELLKAWKLEGFVNGIDHSLQKVQPENCGECYTLTLNKNFTFQGRTSVNSISGEYTFSQNKFSFKNVLMTEINEMQDGARYVTYFHAVHSHSIVNDKLRLYYNDKGDYLLYKPEDNTAS